MVSTPANETADAAARVGQVPYSEKNELTTLAVAVTWIGTLSAADELRL